MDTIECSENSTVSKPLRISFLFLLYMLIIFTSALTSGIYKVFDNGLVGPDFRHLLRTTACLSAKEVKINFNKLYLLNEYICERIHS